MAVKRKVSLKTTFLQFLCVLLVCLALAVAIPYLLLLVSVNMGWINQANNSEILAQEAVPQLTAAPTITEDIIPPGSSYLLLDKTFTVLSSDMDEPDLAMALKYARGETANTGSRHHFLLITRDNEYVVLKYYIGSQYTNPALNGKLPSPEALFMVFLVINVLLACIISTTVFARRLRRQIEPLHEATTQIGGQNLDFEVGSSGIREFQEVLSSFARMKENLKASLAEQWASEQRQREQIAALSHDLKTPLTSVLGYADLLQETELTEEQAGYVGAVLQGAESVEKAIGTLIEVSRASGGYELNLKDVEVAVFLQDLEVQTAPLAALKKIHLDTAVEGASTAVCIDPELMERSLMNIVSNAVDFTPEGGAVTVWASKAENGGLTIRVSDTGSGFSPELLTKATQQFFMGDSSRAGQKHHGMGLYIARRVVEQHSGKLTLSNADPPPGAVVTIELPPAR